MKILVVDDEPFIGKRFADALKKIDKYDVETALSGEEALRKLQKTKFDLLFTELKMPGIDGLQVLKEGKQMQPAMEMVMMSGYSKVESVVNALKLGASDYIMKPFTREELLAFVKKAEKSRKQRLENLEEVTGFKRFSLSFRIQHIIMIIAFTLLTITGMPLFFPYYFQNVFFFSDSSLLRGLVHRFAAVALISLSIYHLGYVIFSADGNRNLKDFLPKGKDFSDALGMILYNLGIRKTHPKFGRFNFIEKLEYLAVVWGTIVMIASGFILWFAGSIMQIAPLWVLDVAKIIHRYEAILAILSIVIWHIYTVHLNPDFFPMNRSWLSGKLTRREMIKHHPLEYEMITGRLVEDE